MLKSNFSPLSLASALALTVTLTNAGAATVLSYAGSQAVQARDDGTYNIGSIFKVNASGLQITHLGVMDADNPGDAGNNGFADPDGFAASPISVGLWSWDGVTATLLASATVGSADTYADGYRYVELSGGPVSLTLNQQYILGARVGGGIEWFLDGQQQGSAQFSAASGDFTLLMSTYSGGGFAAPTTDGTGVLGRWGAANAIVVPEPSAVLLGGLGMLALLRRRR